MTALVSFAQDFQHIHLVRGDRFARLAHWSCDRAKQRPARKQPGVLYWIDAIKVRNAFAMSVAARMAMKCGSEGYFFSGSISKVTVIFPLARPTSLSALVKVNAMSIAHRPAIHSLRAVS